MDANFDAFESGRSNFDQLDYRLGFPGCPGSLLWQNRPANLQLGHDEARSGLGQRMGRRHEWRHLKGSRNWFVNLSESL